MASRNQNDEAPFQVFACLWATALLLETARSFLATGSLVVLASVLLGRCAALWMLCRPAAVGRLLALNAALMLTIFLKLPKMNNHGIFIFVVGATILAAHLVLKIRDRTAPVPAAKLHAAFAPALRWELVAMYFWATVHKLNVDFFDPAVSCGPAQLHNLHAHLPWLPTGTWLAYFGIYGTVTVEGGIPLLLLFRRTRLVGIGLAAGFHYLLGVGYPGFSAMLFAMLSLFAPQSFVDALAGAARRLGEGLRASSAVGARLLRSCLAGVDVLLSGLVIGFAVITGLALLLLPEARFIDTGPPLLSRQAVVALWLVFGGLLIALYAAAARRFGLLAAGGAPLLRLTSWSLLPLPLLVFALGLAPHLGIKNTQSFAMFSNLETGGGHSNHLFIPSSWQHWSLLSDVVTIRSSNDPALRKLVGPSWRNFNFFSTFVVDRARAEQKLDPPAWRLPYFALRRRIAYLAALGHRNIEVTYERGGVTHRLRNAEDDPELASVPYLANKFLLMRAVPASGRGFCMW